MYILPCRILVSFESRYGICGALPDEITKAEITFPNADKERLIFEASLSLSPCNKLSHQLPSISKIISNYKIKFTESIDETHYFSSCLHITK
jgi:hypothetical protein